MKVVGRKSFPAQEVGAVSSALATSGGMGVDMGAGQQDHPCPSAKGCGVSRP